MVCESAPKKEIWKNEKESERERERSDVGTVDLCHLIWHPTGIHYTALTKATDLCGPGNSEAVFVALKHSTRRSITKQYMHEPV